MNIRYGDEDTITNIVVAMVMSISAISVDGRMECVKDLIDDWTWESLRDLTVEDVIAMLEEGHYE